MSSRPTDWEGEITGSKPDIPTELAILPLRGMVVYPLTAVPLTVGQPRSVRLIDDAILGHKVVGLVTATNGEMEEPDLDHVFTVGTATIVQRLFRAPDGTIRLLVTGVERIHIDEWISKEPYLTARISIRPDQVEESLELEALTRTVLDQFKRLAELLPNLPNELVASALALDDPRQLVYTIANYVRIHMVDAQRLLEMDSVVDKLRRLTTLLGRELEILELGRKIQTQAQSEMERIQRETFLREQVKAIQRELGESDEHSLEIESFRQRIEAAGMPEEAEKEAERELSRLSRLSMAAAEHSVIRTYLDWMVSLPWSKSTADNLDIAHAGQVLDEDHYDMEEVKERILEYLAVRKLRQERKAEYAGTNPGITDLIRREREGVILCFVGPPGVGKTSLGQSIARALGRKFVRLSLGGIRDEAEIRGFRRTYVGAMPGRIVQALRRVETCNPVFMLDEVDKLGQDFRGDPAWALLEVLDPEQNREFRDHYLDVSFDLSQVMFITTANVLEAIPSALRDRMEVLRLTGYTEGQKIRIAQDYLVPRQVRENGLRLGEIRFHDEALLRIIRGYTREAGVRNLEREIGRVCRKVATRIAGQGEEAVRVAAEDIAGYLKRPRYYDEVAERTEIPGVATGLVVTSSGGDIIFVEATHMPGGKGFSITGQLGSVMQESARTALSYIRSKAGALEISPDFFDKHDIHLHVPAGSVPKDGPSAGVTIATALASLITGRPVRSEVAMTGEITLRGQVLAIGGVKEKALTAHRLGLKTVILPKRNEPDLEDVPQEIRDQLTFVLIDRVMQVFDAALSEPSQAVHAADAGQKTDEQPLPQPVSPPEVPTNGHAPAGELDSLGPRTAQSRDSQGTRR